MSMKFKRVAAAFDEAAARCESSGSEYWPEEEAGGGSGDLSDLVNSFIHGDDHDHDNHYHDDGKEEEEGRDDEGWVDESRERLIRLLAGDGDDGGGSEAVESLRGVVETGCRVVGGTSGSGLKDGFKRRLMGYLRDQGYDAGLCKSRWEKTGRYPAGDYEYIDVNIAGTRHMVELFLDGEFHIARPTTCYNSLLETLPSIFIGTPETVKQVVRLMATAMKESLKSVDLHVAPWRRNGYMQAKWFGSYTRTSNAVSRRIVAPGDAGGSAYLLGKKRSIGFEATLATRGGFCRYNLGGGVELRVGLLTAAFQGR